MPSTSTKTFVADQKSEEMESYKGPFSVIIPDGVTEIGERAFEGCEKLKDFQASSKWIEEIRRQINS